MQCIANRDLHFTETRILRSVVANSSLFVDRMFRISELKFVDNFVNNISHVTLARYKFEFNVYYHKKDIAKQHPFYDYMQIVTLTSFKQTMTQYTEDKSKILVFMLRICRKKLQCHSSIKISFEKSAF